MVSKYVLLNITLQYVLHVCVLQTGSNFIVYFILPSLCYALSKGVTVHVMTAYGGVRINCTHSSPRH